MSQIAAVPLDPERLAQARAARQAGRYSEALAILAGSEDWAAPSNEAGTLIRAQILSRRDPVEALALLARSQDVYQTDEARFGYYVASMRAYMGTRNYDAAAGMATLARELESKVPTAVACTLWHLRGMLRNYLGQYDVQDDNIAALLSCSDPNARYLGHVVRAYMHAGLAQFRDQANELRAALEIATAHPGACDPGLLALQVHALLRLGLEMGDAAATLAATDAYEWMPWSEDLQDLRFLCVRAMAWDAFLRGESAQAQWLLKDSKDLAASDAWCVMAHLDRAYIARMNGNEHWAAEELHMAHAIAQKVSWSETTGEERQALVMLAVLYSPTDASQAQHYVSQYIQLGRANVDPSLSLAHDRRAIAFEQYALGRVQQVLANDAVAVAAFEKAYEIFALAGYEFRAALAAMGVFETTRDIGWLERARRHADLFPHSALRATLNQESTADDNARLRELTPMQRQIALALCEGLDLAQMSQRFSRSAYTLGKHVELIYERLRVSNRNALRSAVGQWTLV